VRAFSSTSMRTASTQRDTSATSAVATIGPQPPAFFTPAVPGMKPTDRIRQHRSLTNQKLPAAMQHQAGLSYVTLMPQSGRRPQHHRQRAVGGALFLSPDCPVASGQFNDRIPSLSRAYSTIAIVRQSYPGQRSRTVSPANKDTVARNETHARTAQERVMSVSSQLDRRVADRQGRALERLLCLQPKG
jgi:hypothetical protein